MFGAALFGGTYFAQHGLFSGTAVFSIIDYTGSYQPMIHVTSGSFTATVRAHGSFLPLCSTSSGEFRATIATRGSLTPVRSMTGSLE